MDDIIVKGVLTGTPQEFKDIRLHQEMSYLGLPVIFTPSFK